MEFLNLWACCMKSLRLGIVLFVEGLGTCWRCVGRCWESLRCLRCLVHYVNNSGFLWGIRELFVNMCRLWCENLCDYPGISWIPDSGATPDYTPDYM